MNHSRPCRRALIATVLIPLALLSAAGCGASSGSTAPADASGSSAAAESADGALNLAEPARKSSASGLSDHIDGNAASSPEAMQRKVIATGSLQVTTKRVADARQRAEDLVKGLSGIVAQEEASSGAADELRIAHLTLRVPSQSFGSAMDGLSRIGTLRHREQNAQDVTTQVIDVAARVRAQQASVASIERLYARATTIGQVMSIETQLAKRQARLDSLRSQQKYLRDQTSLSTITMTIQRTVKPVPPVTTHTGFLGGLERGWHALGAGASLVVTVVGAVLPFAVVLALLLVPVGLWRRRRRSTPVTLQA